MKFMPLPMHDPLHQPSAKVINDLYERFTETGKSGRHSNIGFTLAPLLNKLVENKVGFKLTHSPYGGYYLEKLEE